jgi:hypothetical protein
MWARLWRAYIKDGGAKAESGSPIITMMEPAEPIVGKDTTGGYRARSVVRCFLPEPQMRGVFVVVTDICREQPFQMLFVHRDGVAQRSRRQLSTQRCATPFCQGLLNEVRIGVIFREGTAAGTSNPYFLSRSKIRNREADS